MVSNPFLRQVGIFRRGKYAGGKRVGKGDAVNEGDQIKKGQVLGYVEQLGTHFAVEVRSDDTTLSSGHDEVTRCQIF